MSLVTQFAYTEVDPKVGQLSCQPLLPIQLVLQDKTLAVSGLLDTGASVNVLPFRLGLQLGAVWEEQKVRLPLSGNLGIAEARALAIEAKVAAFPSVLLAFAWTALDDIPLILGQTNFFREFDVCFFRARSAFEIRPHASAIGK